MMKPTLPIKKSSPFAVFAAGIAGFVIFVALFIGFYHKKTPDWQQQDIVMVEDKAVASPEPEEWRSERGFNLPPVGRLPSLQSAMKDNKALRDKVQAFSEKDDAAIFANYAQTDSDITAILLLWAGADLSQTVRTEEGLDPRVARFLRRAFSLGGIEPIVNNPRLGRNPWPRLFAHYKVRLIAQTPGGQAPFEEQLLYDMKRDRISVEKGGLSRSFFSSFGAFLRSQPNAARFRANLLGYVNTVDSSLIESDPKTASLIQ